MHLIAFFSILIGAFESKDTEVHVLLVQVQKNEGGERNERT